MTGSRKLWLTAHRPSCEGRPVVETVPDINLCALREDLNVPDPVSRSPGLVSPDDLREAAPPGARYPSLPQEVRAGVVQQLVDAVAVRHPRLSEAQLRELTATLRVQVDNAETLHAYPLANGDEPIFAVRPGTSR
jgi:hypothetical protein